MTIRICIFGDSITHGGSDFEGGGWATRLRLHCMQNNLGDEIFALGIGGNTTSDLVNRFEVEVKARAYSPSSTATPENSAITAILFAIGINDAIRPLPDGEPETSTELFKNRILWLEEMSKIYSTKTIWVGLTSIYSRNLNPEKYPVRKFDPITRKNDFNSILENHAREHNAGFISLDGLIEERDLPDKLHPNPDGHAKIFQKVKNDLEVMGVLKPPAL